MQSGNCLANCRWGTGCMYWRNNPEFSGREVSTWIVTHPKITQVQAWTLNKANIPPSGVDVGFSWNAIPVRSCVRRSVTIPPHFFNSVVFLWWRQLLWLIFTYPMVTWSMFMIAPYQTMGLYQTLLWCLLWAYCSAVSYTVTKVGRVRLEKYVGILSSVFVRRMSAE